MSGFSRKGDTNANIRNRSDREAIAGQQFTATMRPAYSAMPSTLRAKAYGTRRSRRRHRFSYDYRRDRLCTGVSTRSLVGEHVNTHFSWLTRFVTAYLPTSSARSRAMTGWMPYENGLIKRLKTDGYFAGPQH